MQVQAVLLRPYYWLTRFTVRRSPGISYPGYSMPGYLYAYSIPGYSLSLLYSHSNRVSLWPILYAFSMVTLWLAYSLLSMVCPMPYPLGYPFPVFLSSSSPLPFSLVYRRYRYANGNML